MAIARNWERRKGKLFFVLDFILFLNREIVDNGHRVDILPDEKRSGLWLYKCECI